jgi:hypothetical protein
MLRSQALREFYVSLLRILVTASEQQDVSDPTLHIIDAISGSEVDSHLADAFTNRPHVAWIATSETFDAHENLRLATSVPQRS